MKIFKVFLVACLLVSYMPASAVVKSTVPSTVVEESDLVVSGKRFADFSAQIIARDENDSLVEIELPSLVKKRGKKHLAIIQIPSVDSDKKVTLRISSGGDSQDYVLLILDKTSDFVSADNKITEVPPSIPSNVGVNFGTQVSGDGVPGPTGSAGPEGPQGPKGDKGDPGQNLVHVYKEVVFESNSSGSGATCKTLSPSVNLSDPDIGDATVVRAIKGVTTTTTPHNFDKIIGAYEGQKVTIFFSKLAYIRIFSSIGLILAGANSIRSAANIKGCTPGQFVRFEIGDSLDLVKIGSYWYVTAVNSD